MNQEFNQEPTAEKLSALLNPENLRQTVVAFAPPYLPIPCFPEVIGALLEPVSYTHLTLPTNREV